MNVRKAVALSCLMLPLTACEGSSSDPTAVSSEIAFSQPDHGHSHREGRIKHVVLVSVDALHQTDLTNFVAAHPHSTLAELIARGVEYTDAHTPTPSDSFPGITALVTGGTPRTAGVYYDDSYDRTLYAPGSNCQGAPGTQVLLDESVDYDSSKLFSGGINPAYLPLTKNAHGKCVAVYPHDFIKVNTMFEVIHQAGGRTAWSDKHPAYDLVNGPSGVGVDDLYAPEINSLIVNGGVANGVDLTGSLALCDGTTNSLPLAKVDDYTTCGPTIMAYDDTKVQAVVNEINGRTSDGTKRAPVPTVMGMNFQQLSVAQKLPVGGYLDGAGTPTPLLAATMEHVDASLGRMVAALKAQHLYDSTLFIVSAKHGQSPIDRSKLAMEPGGRGNATVTDPIDFIHMADPNVDAVFSSFVNPNNGSPYPIEGHLMTDDVGLVWLQNQAPANISAVVGELEDPANRTAMFADTLPPGTIFKSNITAGAELAAIFGDPTSGDPVAAARAPNVFIQPNWGVIYSGSSKKISEHGGGSLDDTHVALVVSGPGLDAGTVAGQVSNTQVAPSILCALGLDPDALDAVRKEGTQPLPGLGLHGHDCRR